MRRNGYRVKNIIFLWPLHGLKAGFDKAHLCAAFLLSGQSHSDVWQFEHPWISTVVTLRCKIVLSNWTSAVKVPGIKTTPRRTRSVYFWRARVWASFWRRKDWSLWWQASRLYWTSMICTGSMSSPALWASGSFTQGLRSMEESLLMADTRTHSQESLRSPRVTLLNSVIRSNSKKP